MIAKSCILLEMWNHLGMSSIWISWRLTLSWSCLCQDVIEREGKVEWTGSLLPAQRSSVHTQLWHIWKTSSKAVRRKKTFKLVPLCSKLQPCIFNFLSPYNVIHWHPSQTWAPAARKDKLSSHAVDTCQEHKGVTEKNAFLDVKLRGVWGEEKKEKRTNRNQTTECRFNL